MRASGNKALELVMLAVRDSIADHLLSLLSALDDPSHTTKRLIREHEQILAAIADGDADRARQVIDGHIARFYKNAIR